MLDNNIRKTLIELIMLDNNIKKTEVSINNDIDINIKPL